MFEGIRKKKKDETALSNAAKAALAGAAMLGAVGAADVNVAHAQSHSMHEQIQKGFDSAREAHNVISKIGEMDEGIDDARGRQTLQKRIQAQIDIFTLALDQQVSTQSIVGTITPQSRERAYDALMSELARAEMKDPTLEKNPSVKMLGDILNQAPLLQTATEVQPNQSDTEKEVRRTRMKDW